MFTVFVYERAGDGKKAIITHIKFKAKRKGGFLSTLCLVELWNFLHEDVVGAKNLQEFKK